MTSRRPAVCLLLAALLLTGRAGEPPAPKPPPVPTVIESGVAEMISTEKETTFTFSQGVKVSATNMVLTCQDLEVVATRTGDPQATLGNQQNFRSLIATGGVKIVQNDREATAERAEVFPGEDKVILSGNPIVRGVKEQWEMRGEGQQLVLYRGQRRAVVEGPPGTRVQITLPPLKDLGYDPTQPEPVRPSDGNPPPAEKEPAPSTEPSVRVPLPNLPR